MLDLAYFGSIAEWFDFTMVLRLLSDFANVTMHLIGPASVQIPVHERLVYHGVVDRGRLQRFVRPFHAFIMPFTLSSLVESADPIKLYEYIALGKETISIPYPEILRFDPFVHFYSSFEGLAEIVHRLSSGTLERKVHKRSVGRFLAENTWSHRARQIDEVLSTSCHV
jgi:hypothetical protein